MTATPYDDDIVQECRDALREVLDLVAIASPDVARQIARELKELALELAAPTVNEDDAP